MKGSEIVVSCGGPSYYAEKHNRVFSETSPVVSPFAAGNLLSRLLDESGDVSVLGSNNINDETFDWKVNSLDKTYEKNNVCNGTYIGGGWNSYRNLQSKTNVSQGNQNSINDKIIKLLKTFPSRELARVNLSLYLFSTEAFIS